MRDHARTVIVGAGIVGASAAHHLAELGETDVIVVGAGDPPASGVTPAFVSQSHPSPTMSLLEDDAAGVVDPVLAAAGYTRLAAGAGVGFEAEARVTGFEVSGGRVGAVVTDRGRIACERVLLCAGPASLAIGAMAGVRVPLLSVRSGEVDSTRTPDDLPIIGESAQVRGFWICAGIHPFIATGAARQVAEWIVEGEPSLDLSDLDANRFYPFETTDLYLRRSTEVRDLRLSPFARRQRELGAVSSPDSGWERPRWYGANASLLEGNRDAASGSGASGEEWSPIVEAEARAARERVALFDLTPCAKFDVEGPDAAALLARILSVPQDMPVGSIVEPTARSRSGALRLSGTVTRKSEELFRLVTDARSGQRILAWLRSSIDEVERVKVTERTGSLFGIGLHGPSSSEVLATVTQIEVSERAFPDMSARYVGIGEVFPVWAQRVARGGASGWELYGQFAMGERAWDLLMEAGAPYGVTAIGTCAWESLGA